MFVLNVFHIEGVPCLLGAMMVGRERKDICIQTTVEGTHG